jgi:hypothetical protein
MAISRLNLGTTNQVLVKAAAGQTSNILEAQNSSGTVVAGLTQSGVWSGTAAPGLVLLNTTSFSGVSSQSINDVFSATYDNYKLLINIESAGAPELGIRMRVGGADASGAIYYSQRLRAQDTTVSAARQVTQTYFPIGPVQTSQRNVAIVELNNPFATLKTTMTATMGLDWYEHYLRTSLHDTATSYTGFTLVPSGSTLTGKVSVYGYNL